MRILIIGAGPAGTSCAIQLLKSGFEVVLIERSQFPRFRPGESCHAGIETILSQLGVLDEVMALKPIRFNSVCISDGKQERTELFSLDGAWEGFQLPRDDFDLVLLNKAISGGADFHCPVRAMDLVMENGFFTSLNTDQGLIDFDYVIDASGANSGLTSRTGIAKTRCSGRIISNYTQVFSESIQDKKLNTYFEITDDYWGYIALIKPNTYAVTFSAQQDVKFNNRLFVERHFSAPFYDLIAKGYETAWEIVTQHPYTNLYHIGDALMTFDPTSSKGILKSMISGIYCAHIVTCIKENRVTSAQGAIIYQHWAIDFFNNELAKLKEFLPAKMIGNIFNTYPAFVKKLTV